MARASLRVPLAHIPRCLVIGLLVGAEQTAAQDTSGPSADEEYGARIDPWLKDWRQGVRISEEQVLMLRLHRGDLSVLLEDDGTSSTPLQGEEREQLLAVFPPEAREQPVDSEAWAGKVRAHSQSARVDDACPVNGENHFERTVVDVFARLKGVASRSILNIGGLYGGVRGEGAEAPDDPTVELLRRWPDMRVLCWHCGNVGAVTRVAGASLAGRFRLEEPRLLSPGLAVPPGFRDLDLLRLDFLPSGQSCRVLRQLLRSGVRPRLVAMLVLSQVPPPFRYEPLPTSGSADNPAALFSCSLSAAAEAVAPYGLALVRLTGPYALFAHGDAWPDPLPISELDCYRGASVWGHRDLPIEFVRDWLYAPVEDALPHVWANLSALHAAPGGGPPAPFTLAL